MKIFNLLLIIFIGLLGNTNIIYKENTRRITSLTVNRYILTNVTIEFWSQSTKMKVLVLHYTNLHKSFTMYNCNYAK